MTDVGPELAKNIRPGIHSQGYSAGQEPIGYAAHTGRLPQSRDQPATERPSNLASGYGLSSCCGFARDDRGQQRVTKPAAKSMLVGAPVSKLFVKQTRYWILDRLMHQVLAESRAQALGKSRGALSPFVRRVGSLGDSGTGGRPRQRTRASGVFHVVAKGWLSRLVGSANAENNRYKQ